MDEDEENELKHAMDQIDIKALPLANVAIENEQV